MVELELVLVQALELESVSELDSVKELVPALG